MTGISDSAIAMNITIGTAVFSSRSKRTRTRP